MRPPCHPRPALLALLALLALAVTACSSAPVPGPATSRGGRVAPLESERPDGPYAVVLGIAQDGGSPQIGCERECCRAAREVDGRAHFVTSLLVVDPRDGRRWLFDATPDLPEQLELAKGHGSRQAKGDGPGRPAPFAGIFLTHAHLGHYTGLAWLGREAYASQGIPVFGSARMTRFLSSNGPWGLIVADGHIEPRTLGPDETVQLAPDLAVTAIPVPHRDEYTDTFAFVVRGPERAIVYLPDIDKWERWDRRLEDLLAGVDHALLDATFFADGEIPGRAMSEIPHPFIVETIERLAPLPAPERAKVIFTHLNHSNPALDPGGSARARIREAGMRVAQEGMILPL